MSPSSMLYMEPIVSLPSKNFYIAIEGILFLYLNNYRKIILVVKDSLNKENLYTNWICNHYLPHRLTMILYLVDKSRGDSNSFPINYLRSLGISNVKTTHYIVMDMDLHISGYVFDGL